MERGKERVYKEEPPEGQGKQASKVFRHSGASFACGLYKEKLVLEV